MSVSPPGCCNCSCSLLKHSALLAVGKRWNMLHSVSTSLHRGVGTTNPLDEPVVVVWINWQFPLTDSSIWPSTLTRSLPPSPMCKKIDWPLSVTWHVLIVHGGNNGAIDCCMLYSECPFICWFGIPKFEELSKADPFRLSCTVEGILQWLDAIGLPAGDDTSDCPGLLGNWLFKELLSIRESVGCLSKLSDLLALFVALSTTKTREKKNLLSAKTAVLLDLIKKGILNITKSVH